MKITLARGIPYGTPLFKTIQSKIMKNPLKPILFLAITLLFASNVFAQECRLEPEIKTGPIVFEGNSTILVPEMLKSRLPLSEANKENSKSLVQLEEGLGGCTSVVFDNENKIIAINIPESAELEADVLLRYFESGEGKPMKECDSIPCLVKEIMDILKKK